MRKPVTATVTRPIPTLAALLAGAAAAEGCAHVECGETRADELRAHGPTSIDALRQGRVRDGLREIAVAAGARPHDATQVPEVHRPGEAPAVTTAPPPPLSPLPLPETSHPITARGRVRSVGPSPAPGEVPAPTLRRRVSPRPHPPPPVVTGGAPMRVGPRGEF